MAEGKRADERSALRAKPLPSAPPAGNWVETLPPEPSEPFASQPPSGVFRKLDRGANPDVLAPLVRDSKNGCRKSETELLRRLTPPLRGYVRSVVPQQEDRDDVLHECLVALTTGALRDFRDESSVLHFALQVARLVVAARVRSHMRDTSGEARAVQLELPLIEPPASPDACVQSLRHRGEVLTLLNALPEAQAEAFVLRIVAGHSIAEVAALTGVPTGTVRSRLRAAQQKLRPHVETNEAFAELCSSFARVRGSRT